MRKLLSCLFAAMMLLPVQEVLAGRMLSVYVSDASTDQVIENGSFIVTSGRKTIAKGKITAGFVNVDVDGYEKVDVQLSAPGYFDRQLTGLSTQKLSHSRHLVPMNDVWMSIDLIHDLNFSGKVTESMRFQVTDLTSGKSYIQVAQEKHWAAVPLLSNTSYRIELEDSEMEEMDPIFINTTGINNAFLISRSAELSMKEMVENALEETPVASDVATEEIVAKPQSEEVKTQEIEPVKEVEVPKEKRKIPEGAVAIDVEAIEAEMRANKEIPEIDESAEDVVPTRSESEEVTLAKDGPYVSGDQIYFPEGKATLDQECMSLLDSYVSKLKSGSQKLRIEVYSDTDMERTIEDYICELRADIVTSYLLKEGVSFSKLEVSLIGTNVLANDCREGVSCSDAQHQANRRVKFILQ